jgi:hypothetical protein
MLRKAEVVRMCRSALLSHGEPLVIFEKTTSPTLTILDPQCKCLSPGPGMATRLGPAGRASPRRGNDDQLSGGAECVRRLAELAEVPALEHRFFDWPAIESDLGLRLPEDYKLLAESFPAGWFRRFVRVRRPERWPDDRVRLLDEFASGLLESMRELRAAREGLFPYPIFPEPGGVLPWGSIRSPGVAFWLTGPGDPDDWPVVVATEECDYWDRFDGTACEFLIAVTAGRYDASGFTQGATIDERGVVHGPRRVDLASRPVFEPETVPPPVPPGPPPGPAADFWPRQLKNVSWQKLPVNELAAVRALAGPPPRKVEPVDWAGVHARLGFALPADYRAFIDAYGPGSFGDIRIAAPGAPGEMDLFALLERKYTQVRDVPRTEWDPPYYPEPGGALCCAETTGGYTCGWAPVRPDPDQWTVVAIAPSPALNAYELQANLSFTTTLKQHAEQKPGMEGGLLPPPDPSAGPVTFTPYASA